MSVSVIVPCHNEGQYIEQCIKSIIEQSDYNSIDQIFVVDDGSTDETPKILEQLKSKCEKLKIITTKGLGQSAAKNIGIKLSKSKFVAFLDGDDYWDRDKLTKQLKAFDNDPSIGLVYGNFWHFTKSDASDSNLISIRSFNLSSRSIFDAKVLGCGLIIILKADVNAEIFLTQSKIF